jgi:hypothetical protein
LFYPNQAGAAFLEAPNRMISIYVPPVACWGKTQGIVWEDPKPRKDEVRKEDSWGNKNS